MNPDDPLWTVGGLSPFRKRVRMDVNPARHLMPGRAPQHHSVYEPATSPPAVRTRADRSTVTAICAFLFTEAMPFRIASREEYIWLRPISLLLVANRTKYG